MRRGRSITLVAAVSVTVAACTSGGATDPPPVTDDQQVIDRSDPADAVATEIVEPASTTTVEPGPAVSSTDGTTVESAPVDSAPIAASGNDATELGVSILLSDSGLGNGQTRPIGFAVGLADREIAFGGSPFFSGTGSLSSVLSFTGDGDLTDDLDELRGGVDEILDASFADLFIGALPPSLVVETTDQAAERGVPLVIVNHVDDGSAPRRGVRLDLGGPADLSFAAMVDVVVALESDAIVIVGPSDDPSTALVEDLLLDAGAEPAIVDAPAGAPSPGALVEAREQIAGSGDRPAVILLSPTWAVPLIDTMASISSTPSFIATDQAMSRADVGAVETFGDSPLTIVRRVDDARRPEQADFRERLFANQPEGSSTHAAASYDAYALAAIAAAAAGAAEPATIRSAMIDASRVGQTCTELADCLLLAADGVDVDYDGVSGPIDLDDDGIATATWFSIDLVDPVTRGDASSRFVLQRTS